MRARCSWVANGKFPRPPPPPFDIEKRRRLVGVSDGGVAGARRVSPPAGRANQTMEPIEPPWQAVKEWIADAPLWPCGLQDPPPDLVDNVCRKDAAQAFPTMSPISTGSTVPGIPMFLTQTGSTRRRHGKHPKSIWKTAAFWFSNTPEKGARAFRLFFKSEKPQPNRILGKAARRATLGCSEYN